MSQTEDYGPARNLSYNFEELLQRSMVLDTVSHLVRTKNIKQFRNISLQGFKKNKNVQHVHREAVWLWHLGRVSYHQRSSSMGVRKGKHLIFIFNMDIFLLLTNVPFSLIIKAYVQCVFDKP